MAEDDLPDWAKASVPVAPSSATEDLPDWAKAPVGQQQESMAWSDVGSQALQSIPGSAYKFGENLVQPFIHPVETAENIGKLGLGVLEKTGAISPGGHEQYADAVSEFLKQRYGGIENVKHTLATDPVGVAADLSMLLTGGGGLAARVPGVIGKVGEAAGAVGRAVDPLSVTGLGTKAVGLTKSVPEQAALKEAGVSMTPGQMVGGYFKTLEDAATSIPLLGSFIQSGRARSVESFNKAVGNQALEPIGEALSRGTKAGHETVAEVEKKLGRAYDDILPSLKFVPDREYIEDVARIRALDVGILPEQQAKQFEAILDSRLGRLGVPPVMDGKKLKRVESELTNIAGKYIGSSDAAQREMGHALTDVVKALRSNLERSNPGSADFLRQINSGWAMYARMRAAAAGRATSQGVFTPSDLLRAIRSGDKSVGKGSFAKGDALMQTFAEAGQKILPSALPTSGTTERGVTMGLLGGGHYLGYLPAEAIAGLGAAAIPYTRPGMWAANKLPAPLKVTVRPSFQAGRLQSIYGGQKKGGRVAVNRAIAAARRAVHG